VILNYCTGEIFNIHNSYQESMSILIDSSTFAMFKIYPFPSFMVAYASSISAIIYNDGPIYIDSKGGGI
jgi:hypothetical protein